jgi:cysteine desulfurase
LLYFDHNATTFVAAEVADAMDRAIREVFGNASSTHAAGQLARDRLESSRKTVGKFLGVSPGGIVFTSGGTEANNLAILGLARNLPKGHVVTSAVEHPSVLESCKHLELEGFPVSYVPVDRTGVVDPGAVERVLNERTVLVSVMHANNETGAIQPLSELSKLVQERRAAGQEIYLHSDGVQAVGKIEVDLQALGVDLYSISAHKLFAPKGIGALYVRRSVPLRGLQLGGKHERERRAGTENVPGAVAFARALELCRDRGANVTELRDWFEEQLTDHLPDVSINAVGAPRLPNTSNVLFRGVAAQALVIALDLKGIAASTGSACSSGSTDPSPVLLAMGLTRGEAKSSVRFSFGRYNTPDDVEQLVDAVVTCVRKLRAARTVESPVVH